MFSGFRQVLRLWLRLASGLHQFEVLTQVWLLSFEMLVQVRLSLLSFVSIAGLGFYAGLLVKVFEW